MKRWLGLSAVLIVAVLIVVAITRTQRRHAPITAGMRVEEIRALFGREEDSYSEKDPATQQHERTWFDVRGSNISVIFDASGGAFYVSYGPTTCGNTPLMNLRHYTRDGATEDVGEGEQQEAAPPALADLARFPALPTAHAQLGALIRIRHQLHQSPASPERDQALTHNARQLAAWEALLEAHGGLAEAEGDRDDEATRRAALGRLSRLLDDEQWQAGRMP